MGTSADNGLRFWVRHPSARRNPNDTTSNRGALLHSTRLPKCPSLAGQVLVVRTRKPPERAILELSRIGQPCDDRTLVTLRLRFATAHAYSRRPEACQFCR